MVKLPEEAREMLNNAFCNKEKPLIWIATVDEGNPHLAPVCFVKVVDDDKLLVSINFASKTMQNIEKGSKIAMGSAVYYDGYMIKGTGKIIKEGEHFEETKRMVKERFGEKIKPQAALLVEIEEVYSLKPKPGSKRIK
ncbi:MAG: pyridoxamine 5'-phosphate oxidase family protein [Methanothermobacter sp.]|nr:pyridoxamine 5'-phosphate oxidase family protein [Methanothermobacter sp.]